MDTDARFCWTELSTADGEKAARFYTRLFGWEREPKPLRTRLGQAIDYTLLCIRGQNVGGMYPMAGGQRRQGARPNWLPYVFVGDVVDTAARAKALGASLLAGPLDVFDLGRMSILQDPQGIPFGAWQALRLGSGFQTRDQPGFASWFEHVSEDVAAAARFYGSLFGWSPRATPSGGAGRVLMEQRGAAVAGFHPRAHAGGSLSPQWLTFFQVDDCAAVCQKVASLQGSVVASALDAPGSAQLAVVSDPQGANFGLLTPDRA